MLRLLASDFFARSPLLLLPVLALSLFFLVFVVVSVRALLTRHEDLERWAALPLSDAGDEDHV